mmetsp:Transcript_52762/g.162416  ORF Transcript_52762/g.162416 Transcript_52762/m.162416 type:complete len:254 (+) Transcript_52762:189-950(+)
MACRRLPCGTRPEPLEHPERHVLAPADGEAPAPRRGLRAASLRAALHGRDDQDVPAHEAQPEPRVPPRARRRHAALRPARPDGRDRVDGGAPAARGGERGAVRRGRPDYRRGDRRPDEVHAGVPLLAAAAVRAAPGDARRNGCCRARGGAAAARRVDRDLRGGGEGGFEPGAELPLSGGAAGVREDVRGDAQDRRPEDGGADRELHPHVRQVPWDGGAGEGGPHVPRGAKQDRDARRGRDVLRRQDVNGRHAR